MQHFNTILFFLEMLPIETAKRVWHIFILNNLFNIFERYIGKSDEIKNFVFKV